MTTLMKRLEAATSRLEDLVVVAQGQSSNQWSSNIVGDSVKTSAADTPAMATPGAVATKAPVSDIEPSGSIPASLTALNGKLDTLVELSKAADLLVGEQAVLFKNAAEEANKIVLLASRAQKAEIGSQDFMDLLKPLADKIAAVVDVRESNRTSPATNQLSTIAEGVPALGWVSTPAPADYVQDFKDSAQFYANRVLKDNKDHGEWVKAFLSYLNELKAAVTNDFSDGMKWNANGKPLREVLSADTSSGSSSKASTSAGGPPPPPPPPPPSVETLTAAASKSSTPASGPTGMAAVLADLNKGTAITSGLRHVDRSAKKEAPKAPPKPGGLRKTKPSATAAPPAAVARKPRIELENNRWIIENYVDEHEIVIDADLSQAILIDNCQQCTIQVKGKATSITITKCAKTGVLVYTLVSGVEIINSSNFGLQITGTVPSLTIDNSHDGAVYLSKEALDIDIYTSQTAAINVNIPTGEPGDYDERPLPEQIMHKVVGAKISSSAVNAADK